MPTHLSGKDRARVEQAESGGHEAHIVGYVVGLISKHIKIKANVTETVISIVRGGKYERACRVADPPKVASNASLEQQVKTYYERKAEKELAAQNTPAATKRTAYGEPEQHLPKKPRRKFVTVSEPLSTETRGTKRKITSYQLPAQKQSRTEASI